MSTRLSGDLMRRYARELRGLTVKPARAAEIARDVQRARDAAQAVAAFN